MRRRQKRDSIEIVSTISASIIDAFGTIRPIISDGSGRKSSQTEPVSPTLTNPSGFVKTGPVSLFFQKSTGLNSDF
jgi:hypothetical protein